MTSMANSMGHATYPSLAIWLISDEVNMFSVPGEVSRSPPTVSARGIATESHLKYLAKSWSVLNTSMNINQLLNWSVLS